MSVSYNKLWIAKGSGGCAEHDDKDTQGSACESCDTGSDMPCAWM